jgi:hypothetical protein
MQYEHRGALSGLLLIGGGLRRSPGLPLLEGESPKLGLSHHRPQNISNWSGLIRRNAVVLNSWNGFAIP